MSDDFGSQALRERNDLAQVIDLKLANAVGRRELTMPEYMTIRAALASFPEPAREAEPPFVDWEARAMFVARIEAVNKNELMSPNAVLALLNDCDHCVSMNRATPAREAGSAPESVFAHNGHPLRHWDRTCAACISETLSEPTREAGSVPALTDEQLTHTYNEGSRYVQGNHVAGLRAVFDAAKKVVQS